MHVWLGGLFNPEAYITATRQCVAQASSWSLEELSLEFTVLAASEVKPKVDECSFIVTNLKLLGAKCKDNRLSLTSTISTELSLSVLRWVRAADQKKESNLVSCRSPTFRFHDAYF